MAVTRFDSVAIPSARIDADGFLHDQPILTRAGVFTYRNPDGSMRREYRPPEEVFRADSLASYRGKPITIRHPTEGMVSPSNARRVSVGTIISEGRQDGDNVRADIVIHDPAALGGNRELSVGYHLDYDPTPGTTLDGQCYDGVQRNIMPNHLSVVPAARAGRIARLNLDGDEIIENEEEKPMAKIRLDGIDYEAAPEVVNALNRATTRADEAEQKTGEVQKRLDSVTAERDGLKAKVDAHPAELEKVRKDAADIVTANVKARVDLLQTATGFRIDKAEDMSDKEIKVAVVKAVRGDSFDPEGKSDAYIDAAFDLAKADKRNDAMVDQRKKFNPPPAGRTDEDDTSSASARQRMIENQAKAYKGGK